MIKTLLFALLVGCTVEPTRATLDERPAALVENTCDSHVDQVFAHDLGDGVAYLKIECRVGHAHPFKKCCLDFETGNSCCIECSLWHENQCSWWCGETKKVTWF